MPADRPPGRPLRIVLTGGPGGGKTTAADMIAREFGGRVAAVRETASLLFGGGFPRTGGLAARRACQRAIYATQREIEDAIGSEHPDRILLCDRGTLDGCVYWPEGPDAFFETLGTTAARERARYDAVLFFESAAVGGFEVNGRGNPYRVETAAEAARLDAALREVWRPHPRFRLIRHDGESFFRKVQAALVAFEEILREPAPAIIA
jgi:hypothetical protein